MALFLRRNSHYFFFFSSRCCSIVWSRHPHRVHGGHRVRTDRSDLPHLACDDRCDLGQRGGPGAPAVAVRLHHSHQEASLSARTGHGPSRVSPFVFGSVITPHFPADLISIFIAGSIISAWRTSWSGTCVTSLWRHPIGSCRKCYWPVSWRRWRWSSRGVRKSAEFGRMWKLYLMKLFFFFFQKRSEV